MLTNPNRQADLEAIDQDYVITAISTRRATDEVPPIRGFVRSSFHPLVHDSVMRVYERSRMSEANLPPEQKAMMLGSLFVDAITEEEMCLDMLRGKRLSPIMFPQSVPSAILGFLARQLEIHGPMTCMSIYRDGTWLMLRQALDWLEDGLASMVIVTVCDIPSLRARQWAFDDGRTRNEKHIEFGGGVMSYVLESKTHANLRRAKSVLTIKQLLELSTRDQNDGSVFNGMVFGLAE